MAGIRKVSIYILFILMACVDRVDLNLDGQSNRLVVDGLITDQPGPYTVRLSRSLSFNNSGIVSTYFVPEKEADVSILRQIGSGMHRVSLMETEPGVYQTDSASIRGVVGETYSVEIHTADGKTYQSAPETMPATPVLEMITPTLKITNELSPTTSALKEVWGFDIAITTSDPAAEANYYRWKSKGIIEFFTYTDNAGFECFLNYEPLEVQVMISDDKYVNGNQFVKSVGTAPYERTTRFRANIDQYSLTQRAFEFWDKIRVQQANTGSLFDAAPAQITGNISRIDKGGDETVLGYFGASAVSHLGLTFDRGKVANHQYPPNQGLPLPGRCSDSIPSAYEKPRPEGF
jgi:hypothetical protein